MNYDTLTSILLNEPVFIELGECELQHNTTEIIREYIRLFGNEANEDYFIGLSACYFHEIGKTKVVKSPEWFPERRTVSRDLPFQLLSSRLAEDIMVRHEFTPRQIYRICWMIENMDNFTNHDMCSEMAETIFRFIEWNVFNNFMTVCNKNFEPNIFYAEWMQDIRAVCQFGSRPILYIPIAATASGKTTICNKMLSKDKNIFVIDYDKLILDRYSDNGKYEFEACCIKMRNDAEWLSIEESIFDEAFKSNKNIFVDTVSVLRYSREHNISLARNAGYSTAAITIPIDLSTLKKRQIERNRSISVSWSEKQYMELQQPSCSNEEFDYIIPLDYR